MDDVFAGDVGTWRAEMVITPPGGPPGAPQRGTAIRRRVGSWLVVDWAAESGFVGHGVYGWDASENGYTGVWVDGAQTSLARSRGTWDAATHTMTWVTETQHEGQTRRYRETQTTIAPGAQIYRHLVPVGDGEHELIRITYRRV